MADGKIQIQSTDSRIYTVTPEVGAAGAVALTLPKEGGMLTVDTEVVHKTGDETIAGVKTFSGNVGIGVTPSAWAGQRTLSVSNYYGDYSAISIGASGGDYGHIGYNFGTTPTSGVYNYSQIGNVSAIDFFNGSFKFKNAPTGTAGNPITWNTAMTLGSNGNLLVGTTTDNGVDKLQVNGSVTGTQLKSTIATGTAPLTVASTTSVTNLNADLLDGNHASAFSLTGHTHSYLASDGKAVDSDKLDNIDSTGFCRAYSGDISFGGNQNAITTSQFITLITGMGAFTQPYWVARGSWDYAGNQYINDTGIGNIHLAGCTVEVMGSSGAYTIRIHTPTTSPIAITNTEYIYVNNGSDYSPAWRKTWNSANDGSGSGLDADLLDGNHASAFSLASHSHTKADIGLGNVDNTADSSKSVNYATYSVHQSAGSGSTCHDKFANTPAHCTSFSECNSVSDAPSSGWWLIYSIRHSNPASLWGTQIAYGWQGNANTIYQRNVMEGVWTEWTRVDVSSANITELVNDAGFVKGDGSVNYATYSQKINPLSGDSNYKLCYTADGQRTNAGEWGRAVMRYEPNGQTYGIRVDRADYADSAGSVAWSGVTSKPTTLSGYGITDGVKNFGTVVINPAGYNTSCTTEQFVTWLTGLGAFGFTMAVMKCTWDYAGNNNITNTGFGNLELAGCVVETFTDGAQYIVRITSPSTGEGAGGIHEYVNHGAGYLPCWRRVYTSSLNGDITGNAATATALTSGNKTIDGDLTITGGDLSITNNNGGIDFNDTSKYWLKTATNWGQYWNTETNSFEFHASGVAKQIFDIDANTITTGTFYGALSGNAATATWADTVDVNESNLSATFYDVVWHSGDTVYSSPGVEILGSTGTLRAAGNVDAGTGLNLGSTQQASIQYNSTENSIDFIIN